MRRGMRFLVCPDCGKRGVWWKAQADGEDAYLCRYCGWYAFTVKPDRMDREELGRLAASNPEKDIRR